MLAGGMPAVGMAASAATIVITDLDIPKLDGIGLARLILDRSPAITVMAISGAGIIRRILRRGDFEARETLSNHTSPD